MGQQFVISPSLDASMRKTMDDFKRYMDIFNMSGELCKLKESGMKFGYHAITILNLTPNSRAAALVE